MKTRQINGHDGSVYNVYCPSRPGTFERYSKLIVKKFGGLQWAGPDIKVTFVINGMPHTVSAEREYWWDGASIPKRFRWLIGTKTAQKFRLASMWHDRGYEDRTQRVINDVIFYYVLLEMGVPAWKADLMYKAVRVGGFVYYAAETSSFWKWVRDKL